ncbi:MAG: hypothetical protein D6798_13880 [Deltaproteobacteria bacterium]|nr:MAG: hypothetical protein D6798_13880 [Deltaproteobacteria bacterium]
MVPILPALSLAFALTACGDKGGSDDSGAPTDGGAVDAVDADGDGHDSTVDCDDGDASVHPGATEVCDGIDNDCDLLVDEDDAEDAGTWYLDEDDDGFGDIDSPVTACEQPTGTTDVTGDCDDDRATVYPGAPELCDELDNDCDELVDADDPDFEGIPTWYPDIDGDGYGDDAAAIEACTAPEDTVDQGGDCDDTNATRNPGVAEECDGIDNDCDGLVDFADPDLVGESTWYLDQDGDGYGAGTPEVACDAPSPDHVPDAGDCDDTDTLVHPGAEEVCDGIDNDCNDLVDDEDPGLAGLATWYADEDGDGYGVDDATVEACEPPEGYVGVSGDCAPEDPDSHPGADEVCDDRDNDCDDLVDTDDDSIVDATWYQDADGDGYGNDEVSYAGCDPDPDYVHEGGDCDDGDARVYPDATPDCTDDVVNDCAMTLDEEEAWCTPTDWPSTLDEGDGGVVYLAGSTYSLAGAYLAGGVDVDGDGYDELLVGASWGDFTESNGGEVYVIDGSDSGTISDDDVATVISGDSTSLGFGYGLDAYGDMDGDGYDDFVAGGPGWNGSDGATYVFHGPLSGLVATSDAAFTVQATGGVSLGIATAVVGDHNDDGTAEVASVSTTYGSSAGAVWIHDGTATGAVDAEDGVAFISGTTSSTWFGSSITGGEDLDGDGIADIAIGCEYCGSYSGRTYIFAGPVTGDLSSTDADVTITGETASSYAGHHVNRAGDLDGDGYAGLLIGAPYNSGAASYGGAAYYFNGAPTGDATTADADARFYGDTASDYLGGQVAGLGDIDGDGELDVVIGSGYLNKSTWGSISHLSGAGAWAFVSPAAGTHYASDADIVFGGADYFGATVAHVGDADGDGRDDIGIGNAGLSSDTSYTGGASLFFSSSY